MSDETKTVSETDYLNEMKIDISKEAREMFKNLDDSDETESECEQNIPIKRLKILVVDDAAFMVRTLRTILECEYEVFGLTKPTAVKNFLLNNTPDLILLDYTMPDINGFELVPIIRSVEKQKETPIIFLTAMATKYNVKTAVTLGACDFIAKPVNAELLRQKIAKHIKK